MSEQLKVIEQSQEKLNIAFAQTDNIIMKKYMSELSTYPIKAIPADIENMNINSVLRINQITKIVYDTDENNLDKLMNVYNSIALCGGTLIHIILSNGKSIEHYIGTKTNNINEISTCQSALLGTFEGNFPGSRLVTKDKNGLMDCLDKAFTSSLGEKNRIVSVVSGIPGFRSEDSNEFIQGMEKLIDSMAGCKYALITIAEPVQPEKLLEIKENYEEIFSQLSPFAKITQTYSESDSSSLAESISDAITESVGNTISNTTSNTVGSSTSHTTSESRSKSKSKSVSVPISLPVGYVSVGRSTSESIQRGTSESSSQSTSESVSKGNSQSNTRGTTTTKGTTDTFTTTTGKTLQLVRDNKRVIDLLKNIEKQIERIEDAKDTGLWSAATYCLADDVQTSKTLASTLQSLCRGKKNTVEDYSINTWIDTFKNKGIESYLKKLIHPVFEIQSGSRTIDITPSAMLSGNELVIAAGLPQKSVKGLSVNKMVSFARNIDVDDVAYGKGDTISLGCVYHMGKPEETKVELDVESLSAHMLITGSTGSGKSNTVYQVISELVKKEKKFLIVEPAKGEYKNVFGNDEEVYVFGTNSKISDLLKINPFAFPNEIHVLEHVDRLIEIFNVCWPMYAAMPAILKDSVLQAYKVCGWDLESSECAFNIPVYPSFKDVQMQIRNILNSSDYSQDNKGDYTGALVTRINSLTNGINGQIFTANEISPQILFDENCIIDLSRIGSQETKSLIMGLVVMKLNEYRMSCANGNMNQRLKHVTVLEEAHNLLRNTKGSSGLEGSDMAGKSVEMLTNSIAEMRTYGEGFIIVDQSPNAIDISAIRNTNTKIIMRLPEESDRQQAGKSAAMSDKQIPELARLSKGIAVVYQNNWLEPVLCKINKANITEETFVYRSVDTESLKKDVRRMLAMLFLGNRVSETWDISPDFIRKNMDLINLSTENKILITDAIEKLENNLSPSVFYEDSFEKLSEVVCEIVLYDNFKNTLLSIEEVNGVQEQVHNGLKAVTGEISTEFELAVTQCIMRKMVKENRKKIQLYSKWRKYAVERLKEVQQCQ